MPTFTHNFKTSQVPRPAQEPEQRYTGSTRIIDLTVDELTTLITRVVATAGSAQTAAPDEWVYGLDGLAQALGCSRAQAANIKASGKYRAAIKQQGRKIMVNKTQLLKMLPNS